MTDASRKSYREKLLDPRWQKKRLQVLERASWACEACGDDSSTLHVHHGYYARGVEPWEADFDTLWCLCELCHAEDSGADLRAAVASIHPSQYGEALHFLHDLRRTEPIGVGVAARQTWRRRFAGWLREHRAHWKRRALRVDPAGWRSLRF